MATPIIRSHAFWPRKLITDPAVLKLKPTIKSMRPGRIAAILPPRVLKPSPTPLATDFRPCQCAHNHSNRCSDYHDNSWYCETVFLEHVSHSLSLCEVPNSFYRSWARHPNNPAVFLWVNIKARLSGQHRSDLCEKVRKTYGVFHKSSTSGLFFRWGESAVDKW